MKHDCVVVWTTVARSANCREMASILVNERLAACVNVLAEMESIYRWKGQVERSEEFRLMFKCNAAQLPRLSAYISQHHPYDTPEWIVVEAAQVGEKYLSWANSSSSNSTL